MGGVWNHLGRASHSIKEESRQVSSGIIGQTRPWRKVAGRRAGGTLSRPGEGRRWERLSHGSTRLASHMPSCL